MILLGCLISRSHRDFLKMKKEVKRRKKLPFFDFCFGRLKTPLYLYQERSYIANSLGERVSEFIYFPFCQALLYSPEDLPFMSYSLSFKHYKRLAHAASWSIPLLHGQPEDVHRDSVCSQKGHTFQCSVLKLSSNSGSVCTLPSKVRISANIT